MKISKLLIPVVLTLLISSIFSTTVLERFNNLSLDSLFWLRHAVWGQEHAPSDSSVVVIAIDEETYRTPPFQDTPKVMWTKQIAKVIEQVSRSGASVIGFDIVLPTSVEPFIKGYDREFMLALRRAAKREKIVLAKVQHQIKSISPFAGHSFAVGHQKNIRSVNLYDDEDGIIRRVPLYFNDLSSEHGSSVELSFSTEIASRSTGQRLHLDAESKNTFLGDYKIPGGNQNALTVNFDGGPEIPTYSLADIHACVERREATFLNDNFKDKVVLFGVVLDVEDRKLTSKRFITSSDSKNLNKRCILPPPNNLYNKQFARDSIAGVYIHAAAINNLIRRDALERIEPYWEGIVTALFSLLIAAFVMRFSALQAGLLSVVAGIIWVVIVTLIFRNNTIYPLFDPPISGALTFLFIIAYRFSITDKDKRRLRKSFSLYLAPAIIDQMLRRGDEPKLGGETREVSVLMSDIANFTEFSERISPEELVSGLNRYFSEMTTIIESHGGMVDKYIGDSIVAVFGAPLDNSEHARSAVEAGLACQRQLSSMPAVFPSLSNTFLSARIGINSGNVLVGNIGSKTRFNYTVMGDTVNVAARLEGINKYTGTSILLSEIVAKACEKYVACRRIDLVRVAGRNAPIWIYEPVCLMQDRDSQVEDNIERFTEGLNLYYSKKFESAKYIFESLSTIDPVAQNLVVRAAEMIKTPPAEDWTGVRQFTEK